MLRTGVSRSAVRALNTFPAVSGGGGVRNVSQFSSKLCTMSKSRPLAVTKPLNMALARHQSRGAVDNIDPKAEQELAAKKLEPTPETVSTTSSTHPVFGEVGLKESGERDADMMAGIKADLVCPLSPLSSFHTHAGHGA